MEKPAPHRPPRRSGRRESPHPRAVEGQSTLGSPTDPRRVAEVGRGCEPVDRCEVHPTASAAVVTDVEDIPHEPCEPDHGCRLLRAADDHVPPAVRARHPRPRRSPSNCFARLNHAQGRQLRPARPRDIGAVPVGYRDGQRCKRPPPWLCGPRQNQRQRASSESCRARRQISPQRDETDRGGDDACERIHAASTPPLYRALSSLYLSRTRQLAPELVCGPPASEQSMVADSGLSSAGAALVAETARALPVASRGFGTSQSP